MNYYELLKADLVKRGLFNIDELGVNPYDPESSIEGFYERGFIVADHYATIDPIYRFYNWNYEEILVVDSNVQKWEYFPCRNFITVWDTDFFDKPIPETERIVIW